MKRIFTLSLANAASALHYFLLAYITSAYLGQFLSNAQNGLVFSAAAILMIGGFIVAPAVLTRLSVRRIAVVLALVDLFILLVLAANPGPIIAIILVILQNAVAPLIAYTLDLFLENATSDECQTGQMRGLFLTSTNIALVASPILIGVILGTTNEYSRIFFAAAAAMVAFIVLITMRKRFLIDEKIAHAGSLLAIFTCFFRDKEVRSVLVANFILQSAYTWMGVYIPLYLHNTLGMSWGSIGPLFALMLLPFLLVELPMGFIEDKFKGARLIMIAGFLILGSSLMAFSFVTAATSFGVITLILVLTRVGAALIEITAETSFFRDVDGQDVEGVSFFRMTRPLGMLIAPLIGSFFLLSLPLKAIFIPLGILCFFGIPFAHAIKDGATGQARTRICSVR